MKSHRLSLDPAYIRWRAEFTPFEARCFAALCEFVRVHFDDLLDRYYLEGHESLNDFPAWTFERYLRQVEQTGGYGGGAGTEASTHVLGRTAERSSVSWGDFGPRQA